MLRRFAVSGFKGFKDRIELDLTAVRNYDFNKDCIRDDVIKTSIIVGKNACGKTNLGMALFDIVGTLTDKTIIVDSVDESSFLNGYSETGYAEFEYEFASPDGKIRYCYRKTHPNHIVFERLAYGDETVFERDGNSRADYTGLERWGAGNLRMNVGDGPLSLLRYIANNTVQPEDSPISFVMDFADHMLYFRSLQENVYSGLTKGSENIEDYLIKNGIVGKFQKFLENMADVRIDLDTVHVEGLRDVLVQRTNNKAIPFGSVSSSGTKALMLYFYWSEHFNDVKFLYMDEFDAFYHYELAEKVLRTIIANPDIQTVLTSHNTSLLKNKIMRPDCCLKMEDGCLRSFSDLTERELRQGHNLEKMYRGGEFGERSQGTLRG